MSTPASPPKAPPLCSDSIHYVENYQLRFLPQKLSGRIKARLRNARRDAQSIKPDSIGKAVKQLDTALDLIGKSDLQEYPPDDVASVKNAIRKYRHCLENAPPLQHATIRVVVSRRTSSGETVVVEGANVLLELEHAGVTGKDGSLTLAVAADRKLQVNADYGRDFDGSAEVTVAAGATKRVAITLNEIAEGHVVEPNELALDEIHDDGILPYDFSTFTLRFLDDDEMTVPITDLSDVALWTGSVFETELDVSMFTVTPSGRIVAKNPELVRKALLQYPNTQAIYVTAYDRKGRGYDNRARFQVGRNRLTGYLIAMPPTPKVDIGNADITLYKDGTIFRRRSDEHGKFDFTYIPSGIVHFTATRMVGDVEYKALADIHMDGDMLEVILSMDRGGTTH